MLTLEEIQNSKPILVIYPAGSGGEHIAYTISKNSSSCYTLPMHYGEHNNQFHVPSALEYYANWGDITDNSTWFNPVFIEKFNKDQATPGEKWFANGRHVLKDHPSIESTEVYKKYLPDALVIYMSPIDSADYFSRLLFTKIDRRIKTPITKKFIEEEICKNVPMERLNILIEWSKQYHEVWLHEINSANFALSLGKRLPAHMDDIEYHISEHARNTLLELDTVVPLLQEKFNNNFKFINSDCLRNESTQFWQSIKLLIKDLNVETSIDSTNDWIARNNSIYEN